MSKDKLTDAIGGIGDDLIVNAKKSRTGIILWKQLTAIAACLTLLIGVLYLTIPKGENTPTLPILQNSTAPTNTPTIMPSIPTTATPISSSRKPTNSRPTASTTLSFAPSTNLPNPPMVSSTTVAPSTGNNNQFANPPLVIWDSEKYNQLFAAAEDVAVLIQHQDFMQTFGNQEGLKTFVSKLQKLPIPQIDGAVCTILEYIPDYQMLNIALKATDGAVYSFTFQLDANRASEIRDGYDDRNMLVEQEWSVEGCETFRSITEFKKLYEFSDHYGCWIEVNNILVNFSCNGLSGEISAEDVFKQLSFGNTIVWE